MEEQKQSPPTNTTVQVTMVPKEVVMPPRIILTPKQSDRVHIIAHGSTWREGLRWAKQHYKESDTWVIGNWWMQPQLIGMPRMTVFELHPFDTLEAVYWKEVNPVERCPHRIITATEREEWPNASTFPYKDLYYATRSTYFNHTIPYMLGFAYMLGYRDIMLSGVDYVDSIEREWELPCTMHWLGWLSSKDVRIRLTDRSKLFQPGPVGKDHYCTYAHGVEQNITRIVAE